MEGRILGSIRFDINNNEAIISYLLDPDFQNKGLGLILLKKGLCFLASQKKAGVEQIIGYVMPENIASVKAFERLGYHREEQENKIKFTKYINEVTCE